MCVSRLSAPLPSFVRSVSYPRIAPESLDRTTIAVGRFVTAPHFRSRRRVRWLSFSTPRAMACMFRWRPPKRHSSASTEPLNGPIISVNHTPRMYMNEYEQAVF